MSILRSDLHHVCFVLVVLAELVGKSYLTFGGKAQAAGIRATLFYQQLHALFDR